MNWEVKRYPAYYGGVKQSYPSLEPGEPFFSKSVVVGNLIFISDMSARSIDTGKVESNVLEEQVFATLDNIRIAVEEARGSMNNVIKTTMLLKNLGDYRRMRKAELEYYLKYAPLLIEQPPTSTFLQVDFDKPEYLVQVDAIGVISRGEPGWEVKMYPMYYGGVKQVYPSLAPGKPIFSRAAVVGNLIFCSGMAARSLDTGEVRTDTMVEQMEIILDKIKMNVEEAGGSLDNVIKTLTIMKNIEDYPAEQKAETEYYIKHAPQLAEEPPANTLFEPLSLADTRYLVEMEAIAVVSKTKPGWEMKKYPAYYGGVRWAYPHVPPGSPAFSRSAVVGNLVFCSGAAGLALATFKQTSEVIEDQTVIALDKIKMYLEEAGTSMKNIVKTTIFLKNVGDYPRMRQAELEYYQTHVPTLVGEPPATSLIVCKLEKPPDLLEIEVVAVIPR